MPNWCNNGITLTHEDPEMIQRAAKSLSEGNFLAEFIPIPESLHIVSGFMGDADEQTKLEEATARNLAVHGYGNWYDFCVNNWGTKWDVQCDSVDIEDDNTVSGSFDSAWAPPITAYEKLKELGFTITAYYYEPGMAFVGKWDDGVDDCHEYDGMTSETVREAIGEELDDYFCISESMAEYEEDNREEDLL